MDDGYSVGNLDRPEVGRLREVVRHGRVDLALCYDPDRPSRSRTDLLVLAVEFERAAIGREFITQEMGASPESRLFFSTRGAVAELQKARIQERTYRGEREKAPQGKVVNPKLVPPPATAVSGLAAAKPRP